jgi:hypothetical protein
MSFLRGDVFLKSLGIATTVFIAVVVFLFGLDDFLSRVMGLEGGRWQTWFDVCSNLLFMFVIVLCIIYAAIIHKRGL